MQLTIALVLGPFFFDIFPMFAMFFAWDSVYRRFTPDESLDIVFDEFCHFLDRCLYAVKFLDVHGSVTFYPQSDAPISGANRSKVKFDQSIYAFRGEDVYEGYEAIRELFNQFPITIPVAWMMRYQLIETIGKLIYQYIADENFQYFGSYVG